MSKWNSMSQTCFVYDYFVHMWFAPWARKFEPNEYKQLATWLKNDSFSIFFPCNLLVQNFKLMICFFYQVHPMNMYLHRGAVLQKCTKVAETIV
jgi:hypothetical protein